MRALEDTAVPAGTGSLPENHRKLKIKEEYIENSLQKQKEENFSFNSDLSTNKPEPLKEFWD